jgi:hypothetical protein
MRAKALVSLVANSLVANSLVAASIVSMLIAPAEAASFLEKNFWLSGPNYEGVIPYCDDPGVTGKIASRFAKRESEYWNSNLRLQAFDRQREIAYRPWGPSFIPRRFCVGRVLVSDGSYRKVSYSIAEDLGIIGATWGVEWCIAGLDRNFAFAPACKMAEP